MCGICGAIQLGGEPGPVLDPDVLDAMTDSMTHRGPDDRGTYVAPGVALGVRRLSIVDVAGGHQPFASEDEQIWAIQNGELYNHAELRGELARSGHLFRSRCDTEVIPHLYEQRGDAFVGALRGKFGIAVWDGRRRRAVLARDRLGVKPLYYARAGDRLVFGSELKAVLASGLVDAELDYEAIDSYLTFGYVPAPRTPLRGVSKLLPGHRLVVEDGRVRTEEYWAYPHPVAGAAGKGVDEHAHELLELLEEAVRLRLMSDVPLGAMLSGGLDSSLIVALMARNMAEPVKTFSVGFGDRPDLSELAAARYIGGYYGTDHRELEVSLSDTVDLEELVWHLDEPVADLSSLGFLAICRLAAEDVTVALAGQGADELLGGYERYRNAAVAERWSRLPTPFRTIGERMATLGPERLRRGARVLAAKPALDRYLALYPDTADVRRLRRADGPLAGREGAAARAVEKALQGARLGPLSALLYLDGKLTLADDLLHYFDRASMAHSLEVRVPFLDHEVVEYCMGLPNELKVRGTTTKYLLRRAARGIVPDQIIDRRKVGFFSPAVSSWFAAQAERATATYLLDPAARLRELLDPAEVALLASSPTNGDGGRRSHLLLSVLMLEVWLSTFLPRATAPRERTRAGA
jgi:asparagine synthase (glutamine-hydrolysing)